MIRKYLWVLIPLIMTACSLAARKNENKLVEKAATAFFAHLSEVRYSEADAMYAGDYSALTSLTSQIPPDDHAALWKNGCEISELQCLPIFRILKSEKFSLNEFWLTVEFKDKTGGIFVQRPCCGVTTAEMPSTSQFDVYVIERDGKYYVTSLPAFLP
jgi:hypothetical protein